MSIDVFGSLYCYPFINGNYKDETIKKKLLVMWDVWPRHPFELEFIFKAFNSPRC